MHFEFQLDAPGSSGTAFVVDGMGNTSRVPYTDGKLALTVSEMPIYVISRNIDTLKSRLRAPEGYTTPP